MLDNNNNIEKVEEEGPNKDKLKNYTCKICMECPNQPIVTKCGHMYCLDCLAEWGITKKDIVFPCPSCNQKI